MKTNDFLKPFVSLFFREYQVVCKEMGLGSNPNYERITHLSIMRGGKPLKLSEAFIINKIEKGFKYYVQSGIYRAYIEIVHEKNGNKYLRTRHDRTLVDNLETLSVCNCKDPNNNDDKDKQNDNPTDQKMDLTDMLKGLSLALLTGWGIYSLLCIFGNICLDCQKPKIKTITKDSIICIYDTVRIKGKTDTLYKIIKVENTSKTDPILSVVSKEIPVYIHDTIYVAHKLKITGQENIPVGYNANEKKKVVVLLVRYKCSGATEEEKKSHPDIVIYLNDVALRSSADFMVQAQTQFIDLNNDFVGKKHVQLLDKSIIVPIKMNYKELEHNVTIGDSERIIIYANDETKYTRFKKMSELCACNKPSDNLDKTPCP